MLRWIGLGAFALAGLTIVLFVRGGWRWPGNALAGEKTRASDRPLLRVALVEGMPHTLFVPDDVRASLGIRNEAGDQLAVAKRPTHSPPLVMPGSTMLDPSRLMRIRALCTFAVFGRGG